MTSDSGIFEIMHTLRSMRRLKNDPVPPEMIHKVLDAGIRAPSGQNTQRWAFLVVTEPDGKRFFGERYHYWMVERFGSILEDMDYESPLGRSVKAAMHLSEHMHEAPVLLMVCGQRDWPFVIAEENRVGTAPPSYGSVYPCVQNILLACRALGLGASLTTMHQMFEIELQERFGIPAEYGVVATIPIGFPEGKFGPVSRDPVETKTHFESWGNQKTS